MAGVDGDDQVGFRFVGDDGALVKVNAYVGAAGENDFDVRLTGFDEFAKFETNAKYDVFFLAGRTEGAGVLTSMTWIDDDGKSGSDCDKGSLEEQSEEKQEKAQGPIGHRVSIGFYLYKNSVKSTTTKKNWFPLHKTYI